MVIDISKESKDTLIFEQDYFTCKFSAQQLQNMFTKFNSFNDTETKKLYLTNIIDRKIRLNKSEVMPVSLIVETRQTAILEIFKTMVRYFDDVVHEWDSISKESMLTKEKTYNESGEEE